MKFPSIPVTGAGLITAAGRGAGPAWEALCAGRTFLVADADPELAGYPLCRTARCAPIDPESLGVDRRAARIMGHQTHMLLAAIHEAMGDGSAFLGREEEEIAFFAGMDSVDPGKDDLIGALRESDGRVDLGHFFREGMDTIPPLWPLGMLNAIGFSQVAIQHRWRGENAVFSSGADATARAVCEAAASIQSGKAKLALAAGVSGVISARMMARAALRSGSEGDAEELGEGAGVILLDQPENVDPADILCWLKGYSSSRALEKRGGLTGAILESARNALASAGLGAEQVDLLVIHGEDKPRLDGAEAAAMASLFVDRGPWGLATKGIFGHLWGGSPVLDLIMAMKSLNEGAPPPSPATEAELFHDTAWRPGRDALRSALVLVQGFDGVCVAFVVGKNA